MRQKYDDPPRGGFVDCPGGMTLWCGHDWEIQAGPAVVTTSSGLPETVTNCLFPDGSRGEARISADHRIDPDTFQEVTRADQRIWRRRGADGRYVFGTVRISAEDAVFTDRPDLVRRRKDELTGLEADLACDPLVLAAVQDKAFAQELYGALCNLTWLKDAETWECSWRYAGGMVADLRGRNESYLDFYLSGNEGHATSEVAGHLGRLGWIQAPEEQE